MSSAKLNNQNIISLTTLFLFFSFPPYLSPFRSLVSSVAQSITQPKGVWGVTWKSGFPGVWLILILASDAPDNAAAPPADDMRAWSVVCEPGAPEALEGLFSCRRAPRTDDSSFRFKTLSSSLSNSYSSSAAWILTSMLLRKLNTNTSYRYCGSHISDIWREIMDTLYMHRGVLHIHLSWIFILQFHC